MFPERPPRPRLAVFAGYAWPRIGDAWLAQQRNALGRALGAEVAVAHSVVPDPSPLPAELRAELGHGLFVPQHPPVHANDRRHCEQTLPERVETVLLALSAFAPMGRAGLLALPEVCEAFSFARTVRAWSADLVISYDLEFGSLPAFVTAALLGLPRVVVLTVPPPPDPYGQLLPLHLQQAQLVVVANAALAATVRAAVGDRLGERLLVVPGGELAQPRALAAIAELLARPVAIARGPRIAFSTCPRSAPSLPTRPFVVLGAERTGSNLLVELLAANTGVACAGELFNPRSIEAGELSWLSAAAAEPELRQLRRDDPGGLLDRLQLDAGALGAGCAGWKLLYGHGVIDDRIPDALIARTGLAVIHLRRADRLARYVSMRRAQRSDAWYVSAAGAAPQPAGPVTIDPQELATDLALHELFEARFTALFRHHPVLELDYEQLVGERAVVMDRLGAFLGLPLSPVPPRSRKTGGDDPARAVDNLAALRAAFVGTRWAGCLPG